jgi:hypothetical protein
VRLLCLLLAACGGSPEGEDTGDENTGACGDPISVDLVVRARVVDAAGEGVPDIRLAVEDRAWNLGDLGEAQSQEDGSAAIGAQGVTDLPGCWGTMLDYYLVADDPSGVWSPAEDAINSWLYNAISDGSYEADMTDFPLTLEPAPIED